MHKKIGILTFHKAVNYGAVLQAMALCKTINKIGADCELIEYQYVSMKGKESFLGRVKEGGIKKGIEYLLINKNKKIRSTKMNTFIDTYAKVSKKSYNVDSINSANLEYDKFIVGSDQMWNLKKTKNDFNFFLDFVTDNSKKYSYAVSLGDITENTKTVFERFLPTFNGISVRESDVCEEIYNNITKKVDRHLDPTFLLEKEEWQRIAKKPKENKYILIYTMAKSKELLEFARKLSKETGLKIINISGRAEIHKGIKKIAHASVEEFLGYFMYADYIVTNSFHGTAFSVLMERNLFVGYHKNSEMGNSRMKTLLEVLELEKRTTDNNDKKIDLSNIDYKPARKIVVEERNKAIKYLTSIVRE